MGEIEKISSFQFFILVIMFIVGSSVLYIPTVLAASAKEDAWIVSIIGGILGIGVAFLYVKIAEAFESKDLLQIYETVFGVFIGKLLTLIFCFYCLILASLILRGIGDFMVTQIMQETPIEVIMAMFIFLVAIAQKYGIEAFARTAEIFFPWIIFLFLFGVAMIIPDIQPSRIFPILDNGIKPIIKGTFSYLGFPFFECVLLMMFVPNWNRKEKVRKYWILGTIAGSVILFIPVILSTMVLGAEMTSRQMYVTYGLAKKMGIPQVFERMEVVIAVFWILTIFYKLLLCFCCLSKSMSFIFKLSNEKILAFPIGMIIFCTAIISSGNVVELNDFSSNIWPFFAIQTGFILPLIIFLFHKGKNLIKQNNTYNEGEDCESNE